MLRIAVIAGNGNPLALKLAEELRRQRPAIPCDCLSALSPDSPFFENCVYVPSYCRNGMAPDLTRAETVFQQSAQVRIKRFVVLSSALIYGTGPGRQSLVGEGSATAGNLDAPVPSQWMLLEALAFRYLEDRVKLTILRPVTVLPSPALLSRRLLRNLALTLPGHDPVIQLLGLADLAQAVVCALEHDREGIFNVAPDGVVPLYAAIRMSGGHRIAVPRTLQKLAARSETLEYLRYPWTVSNRKIKRELGFQPQKSSVAVLQELRRPSSPVASAEPAFDEFGMDRRKIESYGRTLFKFLSRWYWRIEIKGLEHLLREGPAILVGTHRGFMPWDGVMALHAALRATGRVPRFLTHPGLFKFPFISTWTRRLGGVLACQESADRILENGELLGVFPEGVHGAFSLYRHAYVLKSFGRDSFVKLALSHRAPIIPFVTVGSAEILPIFMRIKSRRWTRYSDWPCIPVSTFPFLPVPLPSKWHTQFLPPIHLDQRYGPDSARNPSVAKAISRDVRSRMQQAVDDILRRRRSIFFGSVFRPEDVS
ncbi:MAG TPA: 1-acyl-sn-glycerol-3-phosphate acyltransferase [Candidatus Angelobacter sp.]